MSISGNVDKTANVFIAIMTLGLIGLVFLIIFGNLSGNLGFDATSNITKNETIAGLNGTTYTLDGKGFEGYRSLAVTLVVNGTNGTTIPATNYVVDAVGGTIVGSSVRTLNWSEDVNVTYTTTFRGTSELQSERVITNLTSGATTFYGFAPTWFVLLAIVLLIIIVVSVIGVVRSKELGGGDSGGSSSMGGSFTN